MYYYYGVLHTYGVMGCIFLAQEKANPACLLRILWRSHFLAQDAGKTAPPPPNRGSAPTLNLGGPCSVDSNLLIWLDKGPGLACLAGDRWETLQFGGFAS